MVPFPVSPETGQVTAMPYPTYQISMQEKFDQGADYRERDRAQTCPRFVVHARVAGVHFYQYHQDLPPAVHLCSLRLHLHQDLLLVVSFSSS